MPECEHCGEQVPHVGECQDCGGRHCVECAPPLSHDCPAMAEAAAEGESGGRSRGIVTEERTVETPDDPEQGGDPNQVLLGTVVATALVLLLVGVTTGLLGLPNPLAGLSGGGAPPANATDTVADPGSPGEEQEFDEDRFRELVLATVNENRSAAGVAELGLDEPRQAVAERIAADMARFDYFENESAPGSPLFSAARRLREQGHGCRTEEGEPIASYYFRTFFRQPIETDGGVANYTTTREVAEAAADRMLSEMRQAIRDPRFSTHALGVYESGDGAVYVVYLAC